MLMKMHFLFIRFSFYHVIITVQYTILHMKSEQEEQKLFILAQKSSCIFCIFCIFWNFLEFSGNLIFVIPKNGTIFPKIKLSEFQNFQLFSIFRFLEFQKIGTIFPNIKLQNFDFPLIILSIMSSILILPFVFSFINFLVISHYHPFHSIGIHTILTTQCIYHGFDNTMCRSKCIFLYHRFAFYHVLYTLYTVYYRFYLIRSGMDEWLMIFNRLYNQFPVVKSSWR